MKSPCVNQHRRVILRGLTGKALIPLLIANSPNVNAQKNSAFPRRVASAGVKVIKLGRHHSVKVVRDHIRGAVLALNVNSRGAALSQRFDTEWQVALETVKRHRQAS